MVRFPLASLLSSPEPSGELQINSMVVSKQRNLNVGIVHVSLSSRMEQDRAVVEKVKGSGLLGMIGEYDMIQDCKYVAESHTVFRDWQKCGH